MELDPAAWRAAGTVPDLLRGLVPLARRTAGGGSLPDKLRRLSDGERRGTLRDLVITHAAAVLGHRSAERFDDGREFKDLGFDSLTAVQLRNRLSELTGLTLSATLVFDHPSVAELAAFLHDSLSEAPTTDGDSLAGLFAEAVTAGKVPDGIALLGLAANLRPSFSVAAELDRPLRATRLSEGRERPSLVCVPSPAAMTGALQYARLAAPFRGTRAVSVLPLPGFVAGELLPESLGALVDVLAASVREAAGDEPFVLLGYSSGGLLGYALAAELERTGDAPAGVVLLDTYEIDGPVAHAVHDMAGGLLDRRDEVGLDRAKLTAMGRYLGLLAEADLAEVRAPTLLLQAETRFGEGDETEAWQSTWWRADRCETVPGDHFSLIGQCAESTATAVAGWLTELSTTTYSRT
jgi:pimaricinolide synthase PimS1